jgi:hypothetical protein
MLIGVIGGQGFFFENVIHAVLPDGPLRGGLPLVAGEMVAAIGRRRFLRVPK